ncbi:hypothetical protein O181_030937 [Austropuccinia psidii MF-1]|uniref:Uncharacterized protein n=1 Tax=Austropuccinia psidii MF-1 TaxID=1389203 RepID=A0A9Q3CZN2_9BASI|nr:hypothetical protein [Austropuccinia psidii MF-1]
MSQYKQYYTVYKDKDWEMFPQIHEGVMNSWHILKKFPKEEEMVRYSNEWPIIQASNQKDKGMAQQKEGGKQGRSLSSFYHHAKSQPTPPRVEEEQEKELEETISPRLQDSKNLKNIP